MKQIKQRITITLTESGEGNICQFRKKPSLMELALAANIIDAAMVNNFPLENIETAKNIAWMRLSSVEEVPFDS